MKTAERSLVLKQCFSFVSEALPFLAQLRRVDQAGQEHASIPVADWYDSKHCRVPPAVFTAFLR